MNQHTNRWLALALVLVAGCGSNATQSSAASETSARSSGSAATASTTSTVTTSVGPSAAVEAATGAPSAQQAIELFLAAVSANDESAAMRVLSARKRESRADAELWGVFWGSWRSLRCSLVSLGAVTGEGANGDGAADAAATLRCTDRTRESHLRLQRAGDAWFWDEN